MRTDFNFLRQLLQYELHAAQRHRRFVSLVMMTSENALSGVRDYVGAHVRDSDVIANFDHSVAVLMEETDSEGALKAVDRYKRLFDSQVDLRFSVGWLSGDSAAPANRFSSSRTRFSISFVSGSALNSSCFNRAETSSSGSLSISAASVSKSAINLSAGSSFAAAKTNFLLARCSCPN